MRGYPRFKSYLIYPRYKRGALVCTLFTAYFLPSKLSTVPSSVKEGIINTRQGRATPSTTHPLRSLDGNEVEGLTYECWCDDTFQRRYHYGSVGSWIDLDVEEESQLRELSERIGIPLKPDPRGYFRWVRPGPLQEYNGTLPFAQRGFDPVCSTWTVFHSDSSWFRDGYISQACRTVPRERGLAFVLATSQTSG